MRKYFDSFATHHRGSKENPVNLFPEYVLSSVNHVKCNVMQVNIFKEVKMMGKTAPK